VNFIEKLASFGARNVVKVENGTANEPSCVKRSEQIDHLSLRQLTSI
jgi:hypothetical protein